MRVAAILLALCLCAALVTADVDDTDDILTDTTDTTDHDDHDDGPPASCGASGVAGGWSTISSNVSSTLLAAVLDDFSTQYGANITAMLGGASPCPAEDITYSAAGCSQVVAGTNYKLWINMSCTVGTTNYTVGVSVDAFEPLPTGNDTTIQIYDLDVEFVTVNGVHMDDDAFPDDPDRWDYNSTAGGIIANDDWVDDDDTDLDDGINDIDDGVTDIDDGITDIDNGITDIDNGKTDLDDGINDIDDGINDNDGLGDNDR
ncbi:expressed protein [Chlorella variabilis]|uniref:Expressed protein n=1 Tax=Chlorella variabilis TaxID=554065 RepID=E1ZI10_CHLVA|nr:expressed protein [Chlorella variabilis]EFN54552.1 expressed protein [Chlorella variabilis]|eukprot:XP_005846654.1 expressed protein [Chlorella variabilis]